MLDPWFYRISWSPNFFLKIRPYQWFFFRKHSATKNQKWYTSSVRRPANGCWTCPHPGPLGPLTWPSPPSVPFASASFDPLDGLEPELKMQVAKVPLQQEGMGGERSLWKNRIFWWEMFFGDWCHLSWPILSSKRQWQFHASSWGLVGRNWNWTMPPDPGLAARTCFQPGGCSWNRF